MIIDVSDILKDTGSSKNFSGKLQLDDIDGQGDKVIFNEPLDVSGNVVNGGELLVLSARVQGNVTLQCGACMELFTHGMDFSFTAKLKSVPDKEDPDIYVYHEDNIDLSDMVMEFLLLELPLRKRCKEDCRGLCTKCGTNLNKESCKCNLEQEDDQEQEEEIDSRLAVLKNFFSAQDKEV